jgi:hypothetical protein
LSAQVSTGSVKDTTPTEVSVLEANLSPSNVALSALIGDTILCLAANSTMRMQLLSIFFYTGASLAITPELSDCLDPPTPLAQPVQLGGMGNGIKLAVIGIVVWMFTTKDGTEVHICTEAYFAPA